MKSINKISRRGIISFAMIISSVISFSFVNKVNAHHSTDTVLEDKQIPTDQKPTFRVGIPLN